MIIEEIVKYNEEFVARRGYEQYVTSKYPDKKLAILSCMDTRLTELLPAALGLKNGDAKIIKNAGGCHMNGAEMKRLMLERGIHQDVIDTIALCGIDLDHWLEGFHDTEDSVRNTINTISHHPLVPRDVNLHGYIIDSVTGKLTEVK